MKNSNGMLSATQIFVKITEPNFYKYLKKTIKDKILIPLKNNFEWWAILLTKLFK